VTSAGIRKAALLLMGLDPPTAVELLKSADPDTATQIATELAYLEASGTAGRGAAEQPCREFILHLRQRSGGGKGRFVQRMLEGAFGPERSRELLGRITDLLDRRDPFLPIRSAEPEALAEALKGESPKVAALVLAELPPKASGKLLPLLGEEVRAEAVRGMTSEQTVSPETRLRVATVVRSRLVKSQVRGGGETVLREKQLRKVATLLRGLTAELRDGLLDTIAESDKQVRQDVERLMVIWEDLPSVSDRSLQDALRSIDAANLALALTGAEEIIVRKLRNNMSERLGAMLEEEATLLSSPTDEAIEQARGRLLDSLRELAASNTLTFDEE